MLFYRIAGSSEASTEDQAEDIEPDESTGPPAAEGATTELTQENLEKWILDTAREHMLKDNSTEDSIPGVPVMHEPKTANLTYTKPDPKADAKSDTQTTTQPSQ